MQRECDVNIRRLRDVFSNDYFFKLKEEDEDGTTSKTTTIIDQSLIIVPIDTLNIP